MRDQELLKILVCPETKQSLRAAEPPLVEKINASIEKGLLANRGGLKVGEKIGGGLVRADGRYLYPVRDEIPVMLIDEAISLEGLW